MPRGGTVGEDGEADPAAGGTDGGLTDADGFGTDGTSAGVKDGVGTEPAVADLVGNGLLAASGSAGGVPGAAQARTRSPTERTDATLCNCATTPVHVRIQASERMTQWRGR